MQLKVNIAQCYKLCYIIKIMLVFEFQKGGGVRPSKPPPGCATGRAYTSYRHLILCNLYWYTILEVWADE